MKDFYAYKLIIFEGKIEEDTRKWKDLDPQGLVGLTVKMVVFIKKVYRLNAIPIRIPTQFFTDQGKNDNSQLHRENQNPRTQDI